MPRAPNIRESVPAKDGWPRRGLSREQAAYYLGIGPTTFDTLRRQNIIPAPKRIRGCKRWDINQLDRVWEALPDDGSNQEGREPPEDADVWEKARL